MKKMKRFGFYRRIDILDENDKWRGWMGVCPKGYEPALEVLLGEGGVLGLQTNLKGTYYFSNFGWKTIGSKMIELLRGDHLKFRVSRCKSIALNFS